MGHLERCQSDRLSAAVGAVMGMMGSRIWYGRVGSKRYDWKQKDTSFHSLHTNSYANRLT